MAVVAQLLDHPQDGVGDAIDLGQEALRHDGHTHTRILGSWASRGVGHPGELGRQAAGSGVGAAPVQVVHNRS
ncbi:hypothetical protein EFN05_11505 [Propionibacterium freudenreichii]|nr:hypothetical protein [Propionibacterium freudenreichii]